MIRPSIGIRKILWSGCFSVFQCFVTAQSLPSPRSREISSKEMPRSLLSFSFFAGSHSKITVNVYAYAASVSSDDFSANVPVSIYFLTGHVLFGNSTSTIF